MSKLQKMNGYRSLIDNEILYLMSVTDCICMWLHIKDILHLKCVSKKFTKIVINDITLSSEEILHSLNIDTEFLCRISSKCLTLTLININVSNKNGMVLSNHMSNLRHIELYSTVIGLDINHLADIPLTKIKLSGYTGSIVDLNIFKDTLKIVEIVDSRNMTSNCIKDCTNLDELTIIKFDNNIVLPEAIYLKKLHISNCLHLEVMDIHKYEYLSSLILKSEYDMAMEFNHTIALKKLILSLVNIINEFPIPLIEELDLRYCGPMTIRSTIRYCKSVYLQSTPLKIIQKEYRYRFGYPEKITGLASPINGKLNMLTSATLVNINVADVPFDIKTLRNVRIINCDGTADFTKETCFNKLTVHNSSFKIDKEGDNFFSKIKNLMLINSSHSEGNKSDDILNINNAINMRMLYIKDMGRVSLNPMNKLVYMKICNTNILLHDSIVSYPRLYILMMSNMNVILKMLMVCNPEVLIVTDYTINHIFPKIMLPKLKNIIIGTNYDLMQRISLRKIKVIKIVHMDFSSKVYELRGGNLNLLCFENCSSLNGGSFVISNSTIKKMIFSGKIIFDVKIEDSNHIENIIVQYVQVVKQLSYYSNYL